MSKKNAFARLDGFIEGDKLDVEEFQRRFGWGRGPGIEDRLEFLEHRFKEFASCVLYSLREMNEEGESSEPGRGEE